MAKWENMVRPVRSRNMFAVSTQDRLEAEDLRLTLDETILMALRGNHGTTLTVAVETGRRH